MFLRVNRVEAAEYLSGPDEDVYTIYFQSKVPIEEFFFLEPS